MSRTSPRSAEAGFTLLELTVVLGLLGGFLVLLLQILTTGVDLFDEGQQGQELADLSNAAGSAARDALDAMTGPRRQSYEPGPPDARLLAQWVPLGLPASADAAAAQVQALRSTVRLGAAQEDALWRERLRGEAEATAASLAPEDVEARLDELLAAAPRGGVGAMLLLAWPEGDREGAFLELRRGLWLAFEEIPLGRRASSRLLDLPHLDRGAVPVPALLARSQVIASGLLHVELAFWSQYTRGFERPAGASGPEYCWDSARAGLLAEGEDPRARFSLDLFEASLEDPVDDVFPRAVQVTLVVARRGREAQLGEALTAGASELRLLSMRPLGDLPETGYLKVGSEWIRYGSVRGATLAGLVRGQRGTQARSHDRGARVRTGKAVKFVVELAHGRDNWNG